MVKRQEDSGAQAAEAQMLAKQAQESSRDAAAKLALLEARVAEASLQRTQLEELIQSMSRSRDENVLADVEVVDPRGPAADRHHRQRRAAGHRAEAGRRTAGAAEPAAAGGRAPRHRAGPGARARRPARWTCPRWPSGSTKWCAWSTNCRCCRAERARSRSAPRGAAPAAAQRRRRRRSRQRSAPPDPGLDRGAGRALGRRWVRASGPRCAALVRVTPHRPARGHADRAGAGLLPAREPEAAAAECPAGAAEPAVRHRAVRPARCLCRRWSATSTAARGAPPAPSTWCGRSAPRRARSVVPRPDATLAAIAAVAGVR